MRQKIGQSSILASSKIDDILSQMESTLAYAKDKVKWYDKEVNEAVFSLIWLTVKNGF